MDTRIKILDVSGPYREPREQVFSYDYSVQRASWPTAQAVRVKVAIPEELDVVRSNILGDVVGTPGQQLMISKCLSRHIANEKSASPRPTACCRSAATPSWFPSQDHSFICSRDSKPGRVNNKRRCGQKSKRGSDCSLVAASGKAKREIKVEHESRWRF